MRYLTFEEVAYLHELIIDRTGGLGGFLNPEALESAVAQPQQSFGGHDLYPALHEKAAALGFLLISNHAFIDGNKRIAHAAMEVFLIYNGYELEADPFAAEQFFRALAAGEKTRGDLTEWVETHLVPRKR